MNKPHYICLGDCGGVSTEMGVCEAIQCGNYRDPLSPCNCTDGLHHEVKLPETDKEDGESADE